MNDPVFDVFAAGLRKAAPTALRRRMTDQSLRRILDRCVPQDERRAVAALHDGRAKLRKSIGVLPTDQVLRAEASLNAIGNMLVARGWG